MCQRIKTELCNFTFTILIAARDAYESVAKHSHACFLPRIFSLIHFQRRNMNLNVASGHSVLDVYWAATRSRTTFIFIRALELSGYNSRTRYGERFFHDAHVNVNKQRGGVHVAERIPILPGATPRFTKTLPGTKLLYDIQKITSGRW